MVEPAVVRLEDVSKQYSGPPAVDALRGVSLAIAKGERVAIVGPSGCGKSTLLNMLGMLDTPSSGSVWFSGTELTKLTDDEMAGLRAHQIGFVFQQFHLSDRLTVRENVELGMLYHVRSRASRRSLALEAIREVGIADKADHRASNLSGGQRQRVAIARAIAARPALLLADEPTGNLDTQSSHAIEQVLAGVSELGTAVVVVTHDLDLAGRQPRQISMLDGRLT